jgi:hypothetical protein
MTDWGRGAGDSRRGGTDSVRNKRRSIIADSFCATSPIPGAPADSLSLPRLDPGWLEPVFRCGPPAASAACAHSPGACGARSDRRP